MRFRGRPGFQHPRPRRIRPRHQRTRRPGAAGHHANTRRVSLVRVARTRSATAPGLWEGSTDPRRHAVIAALARLLSTRLRLHRAMLPEAWRDADWLGRVLLKITYLLVGRIHGMVVVVFRGDRARDAELLALRPENAALRRHVGRVRYEPPGWVWLAAGGLVPPGWRGRPSRAWAGWPDGGAPRPHGAASRSPRPWTPGCGRAVPVSRRPGS